MAVALDFNMEVMNWLAHHRSPYFTPAVQAVTSLGEVQGYIVIATLVYVAFDKALAIRLSLVVTLTMCLNHVLKIAVKNPRPFIREGAYLNKWAPRPLENARDLAKEYSTPSGHAMGGSAFYSYFFGSTHSLYLRIGCVLAILLTGLSRPYLGVHYVEDVLLGWLIGLAVGLFALKYGDPIGACWNKRSSPTQIALAVVASLVLWAATIVISRWQIDSQPRAFLGYAGTPTGIIIARPLELAVVNFDPKSSSVLSKFLRYGLSVGLAIVTLSVLGEAFQGLADNYSIAGYGLQYVRYIVVSVMIIFVAPWLFTQLGWATRASVSKQTAN